MKERVLPDTFGVMLKHQHSFTTTGTLENQRNFSDLVPFFVTVESVTDFSCYTFNQQLNPMTASKFTYKAVFSLKEKPFSFSLAEAGKSLGMSPSYTTTVTIFKLSASIRSTQIYEA